MFIVKKKYFLIIENIKDIDLKNIKIRNKFSIIYRNKKKIDKFSDLLKFRQTCKLKGIKFYIANKIDLAILLKCDGIYLSSFNRDLKFLKYKNLNFKIIGSAHNLKEVKEKETQGVKIIFIASLFRTKKTFLGINKFNLLSNQTNRKIVALGGISNDNIKKLRLLKIFGFAGISYFEQKKTAPKRGR